VIQEGCGGWHRFVRSGNCLPKGGTAQATLSRPVARPQTLFKKLQFKQLKAN